MFDQFRGLPVHALVIHVVVVLVPLAALLGVLFAVPRTRQWSRLPLLLVSLAALASAVVARQSGLALKSANEKRLGKAWLDSDQGRLVVEHQHRANLLVWMLVGFAVVAVAAYLLSRDPRASSPMLGAAIVLVLVGAVTLGVQVFRVGDIGARAVWNPTGDLDFQSGPVHLVHPAHAG